LPFGERYARRRAESITSWVEVLVAERHLQKARAKPSERVHVSGAQEAVGTSPSFADSKPAD
jgi:hypothetical protein